MNRKVIIFGITGVLVATACGYVIYKRVKKSKESLLEEEKSEEVKTSFDEVTDDHKDSNGKIEYHRIYNSEFIKKENAMKDEYLKKHEYNVSYEEGKPDTPEKIEKKDPDEVVNDYINNEESVVDEMARDILTEQRKRDILEDTKPKAGDPYLITQEEYDNSEKFDKEGLFYYTNGFLTLEGENGLKEKVQDISVIGNMMVHELEGQVKRTNGKDKTIYVRNEKLKTDFEVIFVDEIYGAD